MRKSFILLLAFFLCVTGYAQKLTISGVVIDKDLNEPLTGVNVLVKVRQPVPLLTLMENIPWRLTQTLFWYSLI